MDGAAAAAAVAAASVCTFEQWTDVRGVYSSATDSSTPLSTPHQLPLTTNARVPNVPLLYSAYATSGQFHLIQQYCGGGDLLAALQRRQGRGFPERVVAAQFAAPLLRTLEAMHGAGVVHRDVKLENIFLSDGGHPYLGGERCACRQQWVSGQGGADGGLARDWIAASRNCPCSPSFCLFFFFSPPARF